MKVLLVANVPKLGRSGELVVVSDAQARNYLLPQKLAIAASTEVIAKHAQQQATQQHKQDRDRRQRQALTAQLAGSRITLAAKSNPQGKLFAAVKAADLMAAIERTHHVRLPQLRVEPDHIKTLGNHAVKVWLDDQHVAELTMTITNGT